MIVAPSDTFENKITFFFAHDRIHSFSMDTPVTNNAQQAPASVPPPQKPPSDVEKIIGMATFLPVPVLLDNQGAAVPLPTFEFDLVVKRTLPIVGKEEWLWRKVVITGQKMEVFKRGTLVDCFYTQNCEIRDLTADRTTFEIVEHGKSQMTFYCGSATLRDRFFGIFYASTTTPFWVKPASNFLDDLLAVPTAILETAAAASTAPLKPTAVESSGMTVDRVEAYLDQLEATYNSLPTFHTNLELYQYALTLEADFIANPSDERNFVHSVLRLYPEAAAVAKDGTRPGLTFQLDCSKCPHCEKSFMLVTSMRLHVGGRVLTCDQCNNLVHYETFKLAQMRAHVPTFEFKTGLIGFHKDNSLPMPTIPRSGRIKSYVDRLWRIVFENECETHHRVPTKAKLVLEDRMMTVLNRLDVLQLVYYHLLFMGQIVAHLPYRRHPTVLQAAILRHDRFRHLTTLLKPTAVAPTVDIVLVGQAHQRGVRQDQLLPIDMASHEDLPVRLGDTAFLWGEHFHEAYTSAALDLEEWIATKPGNEEVQHHFLRKKWAKYARTPGADCRFVGVEETYAADLLHQHAPAVEGLSSAVSVIGSLGPDEAIARGKFRPSLPPNSSRLYTYRYAREIRSTLEQLLAPGWY
ncbi:Aste57867_20665 [Aphanomyces stellatus]|uniref:Aste57867_20665 protein n=1 Tax=Aphanomyces stellatus TaxID=120398 RepID=A0A485LFF8_9STRA|nr:hypothetical protein As57867_020597 [Aphanomyces stellatus]VFT97345.1 Aste57867_20665 [Aphanomyces stellatus]